MSTRVADLPDLLGERATWVDGHDVASLDKALRRALDERPTVSPVALDWAETAARTVAVYRDLGA